MGIYAHMNYKYMRKLGNFVHQFPFIDRELLEILSVFIYNDSLNIYQLDFKTAFRKKYRAYKSLYRIVHKLVGWKLVEEDVNRSKSKRKKSSLNGTYYKITEEGIFTLFHDSTVLEKLNFYYYDEQYRNRPFENNVNISEISTEYSTLIYKTHQNCDFFKLFLYPWISLDTLVHLDINIISQTRRYLTDCCIALKDFLLPLPREIFASESEPDINKSNDHEASKVLNYDLNTLKDGENEVYRDPLLLLIRKIFSINEDVIFVKRIFDFQLVLDSKIHIIFNESMHQLEIYLIGKNNISEYILSAKSIKEIEIPSDPLIYLLERFDSDSLYSKGMASILNLETSKDNKDLQNQNNKFKEIGLRTTTRIQDNFKSLNYKQ
jgi:hypothetical protein